MTILVAPYWNLNFNKSNEACVCLNILVAPYWNLNLFNQLRYNFKNLDISSSILEFKLLIEISVINVMS